MESQLNGTAALVTSASSGIGAATARRHFGLSLASALIEYSVERVDLWR